MASEPRNRRRDRATPAPGQPARQQGDHDQEQKDAQREGEISTDQAGGEVQPGANDNGER